MSAVRFADDPQQKKSKTSFLSELLSGENGVIIEAKQLVMELRNAANALQQQIDSNEIQATTKIHKQQFFTNDQKTVIEVRAHA